MDTSTGKDRLTKVKSVVKFLKSHQWELKVERLWKK